LSQHAPVGFVYCEIVGSIRNATRPQLLATLVVAIVAAVVPSSPSTALETDQYYGWGRPLTDSTAVLNAKLNLELQRSIDSFDRPPDACMDIAVRFRKRMRFVLFHRLQIWAMNSPLVARIPVDGDEYAGYEWGSMYGRHGSFDPGMWMPLTPTIEVGGVRFGTDKLSHFISSGWTYYTVYQKAESSGVPTAEAVRDAVHRGLLEERLVLGSATSGILSVADLEAGLEGMNFYLDLCGGDDPILEREEDGWSIRRPIDLARYVHPGWDESYRTSIFSKHRWNKVEPGLHQYCGRRDDPEVVAMRQRYQQLDRQTAVDDAIETLVGQGSLPDPHQFSLDAVCEGPPAPDLGPLPESPPAAEPRSPRELEDLILAEERTSEHRSVPIAAFRLSYPQIASLSYGVILSRQPAAYTCRTPCDFWGGFGQLEPGLGGGKLSLGWGRVIGEQRPGRPFLSSVYLALAGKLSLFASWGGSSPLPSGQTYLGPELEVSIAQVNMGIGVLGRVSGDEGRDWVVTGHLGWGF
jgi:hypothetical protein